MNEWQIVSKLFLNNDGDISRVHLVFVYLFTSAIMSLFFLSFNLDKLNADVIVHSIISTQNVTMFYWGQNRLLSLLPLLFSPVTNPASNLLLIIFTSTFVFFILLFLLSMFAGQLVGQRKQHIGIALFSIGLLFLIVDKEAIVALAFVNFEYAVAGLVLLLGHFLVWNSGKALIRDLSGFGLITIAMFVNPAFLLVSFLLAVLNLVQASLRASAKPFIYALIGFLSWAIISLINPALTSSYFSVSFGPGNILLAFQSLLNILNPLWIVVSITLILIALIFGFPVGNNSHVLGSNQSPNFLQKPILFLSTVLLIFSMAWLVLFGSISWVQMNDFHFRYFLSIVLAFFIGISLWGHLLLSKMRLPAGVFGIVLMAIYLLPVEEANLRVREAPVFAKVDSAFPTPEDPVFHAGDYWLAWPAVMRDRMDGVESYGLAYRGLANAENVKGESEDKLIEGRLLQIVCWGGQIELCGSQTNSFFTTEIVDTFITVGN